MNDENPSQSNRPRPGEISIDHWMAYIDRTLAQINVKMTEIDDCLHRNGTALVPRVGAMEEWLKERRSTWGTIKRGLAVSIPTAILAAGLTWMVAATKTQQTQADLNPILQKIEQKIDQLEERRDVDTTEVVDTKSTPPKRARRSGKRYDTDKPLLNPRLRNRLQAKKKEQVGALSPNWSHKDRTPSFPLP